jgi:hypothetical protein
LLILGTKLPPFFEYLISLDQMLIADEVFEVITECVSLLLYYFLLSNNLLFNVFDLSFKFLFIAAHFKTILFIC